MHLRAIVTTTSLLLLAVGSAAFSSMNPCLGRGFVRTQDARCARARVVFGGLQAQLGEMPVPKAEAAGSAQKLPEITQDMMVMMALQTRAKSALPANSKVMVFGALDRLGQLVVRHMVKDGSYKPAIQVNREYRDYMRFTADGVTEEENKWFPKGTQISIEEIPADTTAGILCVEKDSDPDTLKQILSLGLPLKKFVLVSKIGVDARETDWTLKLNPLLNLARWAQIENTLKVYIFIYIGVRGPVQLRLHHPDVC